MSANVNLNINSEAEVARVALDVKQGAELVWAGMLGAGEADMGGSGNS